MRNLIRGLVAAAALAAVASVAMLASGGPASAESSTGTSAMTPNYTIEARVNKDAGVLHPTHWTTSTWTFHGAALQRMSTIQDTTNIWSTGGTMTVTCTTGGANPCSATGSTWTSQKTISWTNGNAYVSDLTGQINPEWTVFWLRVCNDGYAYSSALGIKGVASACVG